MTFNDTALVVIGGIISDHPDWQPYAYGPTDDPEAAPGSVRFSVAAPKEPRHRLEVVLRSNAIEIAYDCAVRGVRAEKQFIFAPHEAAAAVQDVRQFLRDLCRGEIVIVRERLGMIARALRRDGVSELAWFRTMRETQTARPGRYVATHTW